MSCLRMVTDLIILLTGLAVEVIMARIRREVTLGTGELSLEGLGPPFFQEWRFMVNAAAKDCDGEFVG